MLTKHQCVMVCLTNSEHSQMAWSLREEQDRARPQTRRQHKVTAWSLEAGKERISGREERKGNPSATSDILLQTLAVNTFLQADSWRWMAGSRGQLGATGQHPVHSNRSVNVCWRKTCLGVRWRLIVPNSLPLLLSYEGGKKVVF